MQRNKNYQKQMQIKGILTLISAQEKLEAKNVENRPIKRKTNPKMLQSLKCYWKKDPKSRNVKNRRCQTL